MSHVADGGCAGDAAGWHVADDRCAVARKQGVHGRLRWGVERTAHRGSSWFEGQRLGRGSGSKSTTCLTCCTCLPPHSTAATPSLVSEQVVHAPPSVDNYTQGGMLPSGSRTSSRTSPCTASCSRCWWTAATTAWWPHATKWHCATCCGWVCFRRCSVSHSRRRCSRCFPRPQSW